VRGGAAVRGCGYGIEGELRVRRGREGECEN